MTLFSTQGPSSRKEGKQKRVKANANYENFRSGGDERLEDVSQCVCVCVCVCLSVCVCLCVCVCVCICDSCV